MSALNAFYALRSSQTSDLNAEAVITWKENVVFFRFAVDILQQGAPARS